MALVVLSLVIVPVAPAGTNTWTGADPSGYWSAPANWSPPGVPFNGDDLVFPAGLPPGDTVSTNDLTGSFFRKITFNQGSTHTIRGNPMTLTNRADCINNSGTNVMACDLTFSGTPPTPTAPTIRDPFFGSRGELTVIGNVGGASLYIGYRMRVNISGQFTGGSLLVGGGTLALYGDNPNAVSADIYGSTLLIQGSQPNLKIMMRYEMEEPLFASLRGDGLVGDVTGYGTVHLDSTLSASNVSAYYLAFYLNGTNVGEYGRLVASGDVSPIGGSLSPSAGFDPQPGQVFTIIEKTSPGPITNAFLGPEGTFTTLNGKSVRISYLGGDGNDLTLTAESPNSPPIVTITSPLAGAVFTAPASFTIEASASDPDGSITNVQFFRDATFLGSDTTSPYGVSVSGLVAGDYTLSAVASDNRGLQAIHSIAISVSQSSNCVAVPSGLVAWWRAEGNANDVMGAHDGQFLYDGAFAQGRAGQAFSFDGLSARVTIPDSDAFKLTNSLTVEGWLKAAALIPGVIFIRGDNRGGLDPYLMWLEDSGHLRWGINAEDNSSATVHDPNTLPLGVWTHVAGVLNGANGDLDLYVNGSLVSHTNTGLRPLRDLDPNSEPAVGIGNHGGTYHTFPYHGLIDEWSLYGRALSGPEILEIYQVGARGKCLINQPPVVTTLAADQLTTNSARLRGQVNPRGSLTTAWFEWGTDTNYGNVIGTQDAGQGSSVSNLNVVLNGLTAGTNYHYRLVATNAFGAGYGANQTFNPDHRLKTNTWTGADPSGYWSAPANWSPAGVPFNGDDLVFPGGLPPADMVSTNDLPDSIFRKITFNGAGGHTIRGNSITLTNRSDCIINSGTNVVACDLTFSGTPPTPTLTTIRGSGELTLGNVGGGSLYVAFGMRVVVEGQFTGGILRVWGGNLAFYGDDPSAGSVEVQNSSTLLVQGSRPNLNVTMFWEFESAACAFMRGDGVVGDVFGCGRITLDSTLSVKSLGGRGASTYGWRSLDIRLNGTNVGEYGKLISSGEVTLSGASLTPTPGFNPQPGQVFTIVDKISPGPITTVPGYDTNLFGPEGKIITLNGMPFRLSYVGGDGNDVTLTANTPPMVTWQQPGNNAAFPPGFTLSLRARATDSDGSVTNVNFFATPTNGPTINVGQGTLASDGYYVRGWTNPPPGQYQLHAEAVDNAGGRGTSGWVQIVVVDTSQPPTNAQTRTWTGADPSGYWSAPANWSPAGVLVNGDALVFPGGLPPGDMVSTNDLTDRIFRSITFSGASKHTIRGNPITLTNATDVIINTGTNVIACDLTFSGTPSPPTYGAPRIQSSSFDSGDLTVIGNVGGGSILYMGPGFWRLVIMGQFTGGSLYMDWYTTLALYGDNPYAVAATNVGGTLLVQGSQPNLNIAMSWNYEAQLPATLSGDGLVGDVTALSASTRITPDPTLSVKNISGGQISLFIRFNGTNVGEYGRLVASGNVSLAGGSLTPSPGFNPLPGQVFTIVDKTSPGPITGFITNAPFGPEGKIITLNGMPFRISYVGGDGNDLTLTATLPRLDIARTNPAQLRLSWPTNYPGFNLQRASVIDGSASWSNHPTSRVVMGSNYTVTQPAATNREFFRLKQP